jgi:hypothetical protein
MVGGGEGSGDDPTMVVEHGGQLPLAIEEVGGGGGLAERRDHERRKKRRVSS